MKSSQYTYPYAPFRFLRKKRITRITENQTVDLETLKSILKNFKLPEVKTNKKDLSKKIFSILINPEIRFGPKNFATDYSKEWIDKIQKFVKANKPVHLTILGFPFKIPVLLKTDRHLPDFGEVLGLTRLFQITQLIKRIYKPGAKITVFVESPFSTFSGVTRKEADLYRFQLKRLAKGFGIGKEIELVNLGLLEKKVSDFKSQMETAIRQNMKLYSNKNKVFMKKFRKVFPVVFRIVNSRKYKIEDLRFVYDDKYKSPQSSQVGKIREELSKKTREAVFSYFSYLKLKNDNNLVEAYAPGSLQLTVSPKPGRLGVYPINRKIEKLYTHGVPVFIKKNGSFDVRYLIDLTNGNTKVKALHFDRDRDKKPFLYVI